VYSVYVLLDKPENAMTSATVLLQLALALLMAVQQPHVPEYLRTQAISVANIAITAAIEEQKAPVVAPVSMPVAIEAPTAPLIPSCKLRAVHHEGNVAVFWDSFENDKAVFWWSPSWYPVKDNSEQNPQYTFTNQWSGEVNTNADWRTAPEGGQDKVMEFYMRVWGKGGENACSVRLTK